jgi:hypothetical protein
MRYELYRNGILRKALSIQDVCSGSYTFRVVAYDATDMYTVKYFDSPQSVGVFLPGSATIVVGAGSNVALEAGVQPGSPWTVVVGESVTLTVSSRGYASCTYQLVLSATGPNGPRIDGPILSAPTNGTVSVFIPQIGSHRINVECNGANGSDSTHVLFVATGTIADETRAGIRAVLDQTTAESQNVRLQVLRNFLGQLLVSSDTVGKSEALSVFASAGIPLDLELMTCFASALQGCFEPDSAGVRKMGEFALLSGLAEEIAERAILEMNLDRRPHDFSVEIQICETGERGCTAEFVYEVLRGHKQTQAPIFKGGVLRDVVRREPGYDAPDPVVDGERVELGPFPDNPIIMVVDADDRCITNVTQPGHVFHPGTVERCVVQTTDGVVIRTHGSGTGAFATFNEEGGKLIFVILDLGLRDIYRADRETYIDPTTLPGNRPPAPPIPCVTTSQPFFSGGQSLSGFTFDVNLGTAPGYVYLYLDFFVVPDTISVELGLTRQTSGRKCLRFFNPGFATNSSVTRVDIDAPLFGTLWEFVMSCPVSNGALFTSEGPDFNPSQCPAVYLPGAF